MQHPDGGRRSRHGRWTAPKLCGRPRCCPPGGCGCWQPVCAPPQTLKTFRRRARGFADVTGLQAMLDPPRAAATSAVAACHTAGIAVKMITGDHAGTAASIATKVGFSRGGPSRARFSPVPNWPRDVRGLPDAVDGATSSPGCRPSRSCVW